MLDSIISFQGFAKEGGHGAMQLDKRKSYSRHR